MADCWLTMTIILYMAMYQIDELECCYCVILLKQQSINRHVAPLWQYSDSMSTDLASCPIIYNLLQRVVGPS